jgi:hypothetical protein
MSPAKSDSVRVKAAKKPPQASMSDKELIRELIDLKTREKPDKFTGSELSFPPGEDIIEVDQVKTVPFSLEGDLKTGKFDLGGNLIGTDSESDSGSSKSSQHEEDTDSDTESKILSAVTRIIPLIEPYSTVTEALHNYAKSPEKLSDLTDLATELLFLGKEDIYQVTVEQLKKSFSI